MRKVLAFMLALSALCSCKAVSSLIHDDEVVARVGGEKLYLSEVLGYVPEFASSEDSAKYVSQYINSWATELLYQQAASQILSKDEMDLSRELEDYRRSLIKYRYEQRVIGERLDTVITQEQIQEYYDSHPDAFLLERPILKVRLVSILKDSPFRDAVEKALAEEDGIALIQSDTVLRSAAIRLLDLSDVWTDAIVLSKEFGTDYGTMLGHLSGRRIVYEPSDRGDAVIAQVVDIRHFGNAPLEHCTDRIRELILSARKRDLLLGLEQDLLKDALENRQFVIYQK